MIAILVGLCWIGVGLFADTVSAQEKAIVRSENIEAPGHQLKALRSWGLQKELKLTGEQIQMLMSVPSEASKAIGHDHPDLIGLPSNQRMLRQEQLLSEFYQNCLDEALLPSQRSRLGNLMYYYEIALIGIDASIEFGSLGRDAGIEDRQKHSLAEAARAELRDASRAEARIRQSAYDKILVELSPEQRDKCIKHLGAAFEYCDDKVLHNRQLLEQEELLGVKANNLFTAPDYSQFVNLLEIVSVQCIVEELQITSSQLAGCMKLRNETKELLRMARQKAIEMPKEERMVYLRALPVKIENNAQAAVNEILLPAQLERLRQLANYAEIAYNGFDLAITEGYLAGKIGVTENQITSLQQKVHEINADMNHDIRRLKESTQFRILSRFPDSQRETARKLLGDFFILEDSSFLLARQRKREADALNAEQNEANAPIPPKKK